MPDMPAPIEIPNDLISLIGQQVCRKARAKNGPTLEVDSVIKGVAPDGIGGWTVIMLRLDGVRHGVSLPEFYAEWEIRK